MMSPAPTPTTPQPEHVTDLLALMDAEQVAVLADRLASVSACGFGVVSLVVVGGQIEFIKVEVSVDVRRGRRRPRPV